MKRLLAACALAAGVYAVPASAAPTVVSPCDVTLTSPDAVACSGYYDKNVLSNSNKHLEVQIAGLAELGYTFDGDWSSVEGTKVESLSNGNQIDFGQMLYGMTYVGAHLGNIAGPAQNVTVFWAFDFGTEGAQFITLDNVQGFSNAVLFATGVPAVPEPSTWLMMLFGFGAVGAALRRRKISASSLITAKI